MSGVRDEPHVISVLLPLQFLFRFRSGNTISLGTSPTPRGNTILSLYRSRGSDPLPWGTNHSLTLPFFFTTLVKSRCLFELTSLDTSFPEHFPHIFGNSPKSPSPFCSVAVSLVFPWCRAKRSLSVVMLTLSPSFFSQSRTSGVTPPPMVLTPPLPP